MPFSDIIYPSAVGVYCNTRCVSRSSGLWPKLPLYDCAVIINGSSRADAMKSYFINMSLLLVFSHESPCDFTYIVRLILFNLGYGAFEHAVFLTLYLDIAPRIVTFFIIESFAVIIIQTVVTVLFTIVTDFEIILFTLGGSVEQRVGHRDYGAVLDVDRYSVKPGCYFESSGVTDIFTCVEVIPVTGGENDLA